MKFRTKLHGLWLLLASRDWLLYTEKKIIGDVADDAHWLMRQQADVLERIK